ncbi:hypothetical protein DIKCMJMK_02596 [Shewanella oneidensis]|nr:hypothetical protein [Shewanella oneidensis]
MMAKQRETSFVSLYPKVTPSVKCLLNKSNIVIHSEIGFYYQAGDKSNKKAT